MQHLQTKRLQSQMSQHLNSHINIYIHFKFSNIYIFALLKCKIRYPILNC